ncbi:SDR family NAD(P)-dependent oxidoreductase [Adonisia turfae]
MSLKHILQSLQDGDLSLEEARRDIRANSNTEESNGHLKGNQSEALGSPDVLQESLRESLAAALYMDKEDVDLDEPFSEMGLDSIVNVEWIQTVNQQYGLKIPATRTYDYPTIIQFADYLGTELQGKLPTQLHTFTSAIASSADTVVTSQAIQPAQHPDGQTQQPLTQAESHPPAAEGIAIVGMSGRYPGAADLQQFWDNLKQGRNSVAEIPKDRWDVNEYYDPDPAKPGKIYCKWLGVLADIDCFDTSFFMIPPAEAELMDPQHRIFLEEAYRAFEDAGYSPQVLDGKKCGVYMGIMNSEYVHLLSQQQVGGLNTGNSYSIAAARIPYHLNLKGPAIPIDTACSSSLVAVHLACQALRSGEIDMALVGGVTLYLTPASYVGMCAAGMLSPDGQCKSFDTSANGFVPGEGAGLVVLKRLEDAERDGDGIHGVIIGSGINQDGRTNGITAPSVQSQIELERTVYDRFQIDPATISYVETHGTGTQLGDPIEFEALTKVFHEKTDQQHYCALGSVKSNIGHTSAAAGMAGIHKVLLSLKHQQLVPSLHFKHANVHCDFENSPFYVNTELKDWSALADHPRRVAVSSFGFSGTNAHVVIEEYVQASPSPKSSDISLPTPVVLSARDEDRLRDVVENLRAFLTSGSQTLPSLKDFAHTLQVGREAMQERLAWVVSSLDELIEKLTQFLENEAAGSRTFRGRVQRQRGRLALFQPDQETLQRIEAQSNVGDYSLLLELWVTGLVFDWDLIWPQPKQCRHVSLPTYPFAKERYWVPASPEPTASVHAGSRPLIGDGTPPPATILAMPPRLVALGDPTIMPSAFPAPAVAKVPRLLHPPMNWWMQQQSFKEPSLFSVNTEEHGDGVVSVLIDSHDGCNQLTQALLDELAQALAIACDRADVNVVLLRGNDDGFLTSAPSAAVSPFDQQLSRLTLDQQVPIIAVMKGSASGAGLMVGALCDLMICGEESELRLLESGAEASVSQAAMDFLTDRFGPAIAKALIQPSNRSTGGELYDLGIGCLVLPRHDIDEFALDLAHRMAGAPRQSLTLLKRHLSRPIAATFDRTVTAITRVEDADLPLASEASEALLQSAFKVTATPEMAAPEIVNLQSKVVKLEIFSDGVAVLTMDDRDSKNTFTEALAQGLAEAFAWVEKTFSIKVVVLTGYGHYFACGGTREALLAIQAGRARFTDSRVTSLPLECNIPVIAAMQGHGIGAGWALGMFCDGAVFSAESVYHSPYMQYGFTPGAGSTLIIPHQFGHDLGGEILFGAREFKGHELKRRGITMPVLPRSDVLAGAMAAAHHLASASRQTLMDWKQTRVRVLRQRLESIYAAELAMHEQTFVGSQEVRARIETLYGGPSTAMATQMEQTEAQSDYQAAETSAMGDEVLRSEILRTIVHTLRETLAAELHMALGKIKNDVAFIEMGLDSINSVTWMREVNQRYGLSIPATEIYNHPTINELARYVRHEGNKLGLFLPDNRLPDNRLPDNRLPDNSPLPQPQPSAVSTATVETPRVSADTEQMGGFETTVRSQTVSRDRELTRHDIAVIGMAGQFPMARDITTFWNNLLEGKDCISEVPPTRWPLESYYDLNPEVPGKTYSKWMGMLEDVDKFDPLFFNISPMEAEAMDPQQRLFLQSCWSCIEDAGYDPLKLAGSKCGVFAGCGPGDYGLGFGGAERDASTLMGGSMSILAARISYVLNLQGPCVAMDTACSSSLVAIASACDSLTLGNSDLAFAGGVAIMAGPMMHIMTSKAGMLSPDGRCFTFDQRANGFVPGEGVGVILLKRLEDAERDGDRIDGVIRGWGVNQDGKTNGITAPNGDAQTRLEKYVYDRFGLNPDSIQMVEAHGTGTKLGDPIEVAGLKKSFQDYTSRKRYCALGSVKSNVGHLLAAAGIAGAIKSILALKYRKLPPTIHFEALNEHIDLENSPFYVNTSCRNWEIKDGEVRRAAVSGFGFSGTNAHVVFEEYVPSFQKDTTNAPLAPAVILLSAKNRDRLRAIGENLLHYMDSQFKASGCSLHDLAYTLQIGRAAMTERLAFVAKSEAALKTMLQRYLSGDDVVGLFRGHLQRDQDALSRLAADGAMQELVAKWMAQEDYAKLMELWVDGLDIDWQCLHAGKQRRRVSLPTYPFAREHYWRRQAAPMLGDETVSTSRVLPILASSELTPSLASSTLLCRPVWKAAAVSVDEHTTENFIRHVILLCGSFESQAAAIESGLPGARCTVLHCDATDIAVRFGDVSCQVFETIKSLLLEKAEGKTLVQVLIDSQGEGQILAGLAGLLQTATLENPAMFGQVIELQPDGDPVTTLLENHAQAEDVRIRYVDGNRMVLTFEELTDVSEEPSRCWQDEGVYLITGGAGELAALFAEEIVSRVATPNIILVGRSVLNDPMQARLDRLATAGARVDYRQVDVADETAVTDLMKSIRRDFGRLDGVLHAAGMIRDNFVTKKTTAEFKTVLAAKVEGTVLLERASRELAPKLIVLFSSCSGVTGNLGQADYAAANAFMDAFAHGYGLQHGANARPTRIVSVNWPLWNSGGMRVDDATLAAMHERTGSIPLESDAGLKAFYQIIASGLTQVMILSGETKRLRQVILSGNSKQSANDVLESAAAVDEQELCDRTLDQVKSLLGDTINLAKDRIDDYEPLESYGIDSILVTQLNLKLGRVFPEVSQTLLFEIRNLRDLTDHLVDTFRLDCIRWTGLDTVMAPVTRPTTTRNATKDVDPPAEDVDRVGNNTEASLVCGGPRQPIQEPIAIIGISGRYPQADSLDTYWENLKTGKDCITDIPEERWSLDGFYHPDPQQAVAQGLSYSKWGGFLNGFADFDPLFFNISPLEAMGIDPQERLFLQAAWEAVESAGYSRARLAQTVGGNVGVFAGITKTGFDRYARDWANQGETAVPNTSFGSVANRVSYLLNLHGPSMPIDTMCSSSLTAIHEACQHLRQGDCAMALAGGVNLYLHPSSYVGLCAQYMLSKTGQCRSFGDGSNGFVPGEGVGVVLLKPLSDALADGDPIHAVIRATQVNHGGKTNGYTVPNPKAQSELIRQALDNAGIDARSVSYVEAHGTGTELGDPIEVSGLTQAFQTDTTDTGYCALGSVKSNIGHLEAAAGIAALTKVVLQMRHGELTPSLHAETLNPKIPFPKTPFKVQVQPEPWERPRLRLDGPLKEYPYVAGISSFGAGGSNAHVILAEPPSRVAIANDDNNNDPVIIVLSAKTEDSLSAYVEKLLHFLSRADASEFPALRDIAFTLQTGRDPMEERVGFIARTRHELIEKLQGFLATGPDQVKDCVRDYVARGHDSLTRLAHDEDAQAMIRAWHSKRKLSKLLDLWVKGMPIDWEQLYGHPRPNRVVLPTYPFQQEPYWIRVGVSKANERQSVQPLHPLLHQNTSDLDGLRFSSVFLADAPYVADHVVGGQKLLPGVACLEMARAAVEQISGPCEGLSVRSINHVVWARPMVVAERPQTLHVGLLDEGEGKVRFEIYSSLADDSPVLHGQGVAMLQAVKMESETPVLDLDRLKAEVVNAPRFDAAQCYATFQSMGVNYGPSHQSLVELFADSKHVLARLQLPDAALATSDAYLLHPSLLDGALQAAIGLALQGGQTVVADNLAATVPFALDELQIFAPWVNDMWVWIQVSEATSPSAGGQKLDFELCDAHGQVCIRMKGFTFRPLPSGSSHPDAASSLLLAYPEWREQSVMAADPSPNFEHRHLLVYGVDGLSDDVVHAKLPGVTWQQLPFDQDDVAAAFAGVSTQVFRLTQELLAKKPTRRVLVQILIPSKGTGNLFSGLAGLLHTARLENPLFAGQVIEVDVRTSADTLVQILAENATGLEDVRIQYERGVRRTIHWCEFASPMPTKLSTVPWKSGGVYWITGGMGGLGRLFAKYIATETQDVTLILTGRSALAAEQREWLETLNANGARVDYRQADISLEADVERLAQEIVRDYVKIDGILHAAGVLQDAFILQKPVDEFQEVLSPKVAGAWNLDRATRQLDLDFFALFAAGAGLLGNPGQSDYATANAFLDAFAHFRNGRVERGERSGRTVSIDWPLWQDGGMKMVAAAQATMTDKLGLTSMASVVGLEAFECILASGKGQMMPLTGDLSRLRSLLKVSVEPDRTLVEVDHGSTARVDEYSEPEAVAIDYLRQLITSALHIPPHRLRPDESFSQFGIDSIVVMNLTNQLEETFGSLPKTLFFEYDNIGSLARYFVETHRAKLTSVIRGDRMAKVRTQAATTEPLTALTTTVPTANSMLRTRRHRSAVQDTKPQEALSSRALDIAIIGLSGRYPMAADLKAFWANLRDGRDCITEVPPDRWNWRDYYSDESGNGAGHSSKWGGFIDDVDKFDPQFFNISPRVAPFIDPQERLILEETWKALEDAGYRPQDLQAKLGEDTVSPVGVYIGSMYGEYQLLGAESTMVGKPAAFAGNLASIANRVSYVLNLNGPSMMVDTMCSSSLTCVHLACQDLKSGRTDLGIAGGVNLTVHPNKYLMLSGGQFISTQGRCESFGEGGDGYIPSEGVGVVLLKRLADAQRDGDHIYGVIKGSALNHGGRTNGYSVPNPNAQKRVIVQALNEAGIDPRAVSYIEAHGTGTKLGDPIEIAGLTKAFGLESDNRQCWIGSAKSNIGHCEAAAGIAGLTKVLLQMQHQQIVPSIHSSVLNPHIDFASTPFVVNQDLRDWQPASIDGRPMKRIAGISSFGAGGSNAHLVIEEAPNVSISQPLEDIPNANFKAGQPPRALILLSARSEEQLRQAARNLRDFVTDPSRASDTQLHDIAYTLQVGREPMTERLGFVVDSMGELRDQLEMFLNSALPVEGQLRGRDDQQLSDGFKSLSSNSASNAMVDRFTGGGDGQEILQLWVCGHEFDWTRLYRAISPSPRRISLPTRPFTHRRYWVERPGTPSGGPWPMAAQVAIPPQTTPSPMAELTGLSQPLATLDGMESRFMTAMPNKPNQLVELTPLSTNPQFSRNVVSSEQLATDDAEPIRPAESTSEPVAALRSVAPPSERSVTELESLQKKLLTSLAETLFMGVDEIGLDKPFMDLGLDSIVAAEWIRYINQEFGLDIAAAIVYEHGTLRKFTAFLDNEISDLSPSVSPSPVPLADPLPVTSRETQPIDAAVLGQPSVVQSHESETAAPDSLAINSAHHRLETSHKQTSDIAIVGMSGRFPGGPDLDAFWHLIERGETAFSPLPRDRDWDLEGIYHSIPHPNKTYVRRGGFLQGIDCFDPLFFEISPKEAMTMDPCERLFLEESWRAIEDAGIDPKSLSGCRWGVFCGNGGDYSLRLKEVLGFSPHVTLSQVPARVAHCLDLNGPCQSVDAGCASSLLAIAQACDQLVMHRCEAAIAGGALLHSTPNLLISACQIELLSAAETGHALDAQANGMMPAEAVSVVVLKRLADALADGDRIHGVIEGWGSNHNGKTNGMVTPNADAEVALLEEVYTRFGIDPQTVTLMEANASGMPLADTVEAHALTRIFGGATTKRQQPCVLGTVENNVGHAFHASGMSHLMKTLLAMRYQRIPGTPNVRRPSDSLDLENSPFSIIQETLPWEVEPGQLRRAAINSFGATGTNVHLVLSESPAVAAAAEPISVRSGPVLIPLSARTASGLRQRCCDLQHWLDSSSEGLNCDLQRLSANLLMYRSHFEERCAIVVSDVATLRTQLSRIGDGHPIEKGFLGRVDASSPLSPALSTLAAATIKGLQAPLQPTEEDLIVLADLYTKGVNLDMSACFTAAEQAVLSLPGYPFEKRRCWVSGTGSGETSQVAQKITKSKPTAEIVEHLKVFVGELTGLSPDEIESGKPLSAYGVDSLMGMRLLNRINAFSSEDFDASLLQNSSLDEMAATIQTGSQWNGDELPSSLSPLRTSGIERPCPAFIERLELAISPGTDVINTDNGEAQLEHLIQHGVGVWSVNGRLCFEFLKGTQTRESVQSLLSHPRSLLSLLTEGVGYYPTSQMQRFALDASEVHGKTALNIGQAFWIDSPVNMELLHRAFNEMTQHHAILRTGIRRAGEQWVQVVYERNEVNCQEELWPDVEDQATFLDALETFQLEQIGAGFDAAQTTLLDLFVVHNGKELGAIYFQTHHFHADGFTLFLLQQELYQRYRALVEGADWTPPTLRAEYAHFSLSLFESANAENTQFWQDYLNRQAHGPMLRDRAEYLESVSPKAGVLTIDTSIDLLDVARRFRVTLTQMVACVVGVLMYRLTGQNMVMQMVYNLRDRYEFENVFGDFSSSAPLTLDIQSTMTLRDVFACYSQASLELQMHKRFDFMDVIGQLGSSGKWSGISIDSNDRDALCQVTDFAERMIDMPLEERDPVGPLVVCLVKTAGQLTLQLLYDKSLLSSCTIELFGQAVKELLVKMTNEPELRILDFQPPPELMQRLLAIQH